MEKEITVLKLETASLVAENIRTWRRLMAPSLDRRPRRLLIDLGPLRYFDSKGFTEILRWLARAERAEDACLCSEVPEVHALFELVGGASIFECYWSREEALRALLSETASRTVGADGAGSGGSGRDVLDGRFVAARVAASPAVLTAVARGTNLSVKVGNF